MIFARIWITATLAFAGLSGLSAAQNVGTVDGVARANVGTINGVPMANVGTINGVDNTPAGGGSGQDFTDDFNRADSTNIGAAWVEVIGDWDISTQRLRVMPVSYAHALAVYSGQSTSTADQYVQVTLQTALGSAYPGIVLRYTDASSPFYVLQFRVTEGEVRWNRFADSAATSTAIGTIPAVTTTSLDVWVITIEGTGTGITLRGWKNPGTNYDRARDTPDNLNGDITPDFAFTADDPSPINSGSMVGFQGYQSSSNRIIFDNFRGGDA